MSRPLSLLLAALAWSGPALAAAPKKPAPKAPAPQIEAPAAPQFVRELEGVREYRLANGLQVLLIHDPAATTTLVDIVYRVGSRHEGPGEAGMAHLLEHLLFKGTPSFPDIWLTLRERGVTANGSTSLDFTHYFGQFNASAETLDLLLRLESERMQRSRVEAEDLSKEMPVVTNELELKEGAALLLQQRVTAVAYRFHPYGRPVMGTRSDLAHVPIEPLRAFYRTHYRPDNATLMVAGQFDPEATLALVQQRFAALPRPAAALLPTYTVEPPQEGEREVVVRRVGDRRTTLLAYHVPNLAHPDCAAVRMLGSMLSQSSETPALQSEPRSTFRAYSCGGYDPGLFYVHLIESSGTDPDGTKALEREQREHLTQERFDRARSQELQEFSKVQQDSLQLAQALLEPIGAGDWRIHFKQQALIKDLKLDEVRRVAAQYLTRNNRNLGRFEPVQASGQVLVPLLADRSAGLDALGGGAASAVGERLDPQPLALQARTQFKTLPASGIKLALIEKPTRGQQVAGQLRLHWGRAAETAALRGVQVIGTLLSKDRALKDAAFALKGSLQFQTDPQGVTVQLQGDRESFLDLLKLALRTLRQPELQRERLERVKAAEALVLAGSRSELDIQRRQAVRDHFNQAWRLATDDPDYLPSLDDRISWIYGLSIESVQQLHDRFWSANEGEASFVGALPEGLAAALDQELAAWKKPGAPAFERHVTPFRPVPAAQFHAQANDTANAYVVWQQALRIRRDDPDAAALLLADRLLGGQGADSRLMVHLRQRGSLTYAVNSFLKTGEWGDATTWFVATVCAPQNRLKVEAAVREVLDSVLRDGFTATEIESAKTSLLAARQQARSDDAMLAERLNELQEHAQDWRAEEQWEQRIRALDAAQVLATLRKYLKPEEMVLSSAGDYQAKPPVQP